MLRNLIKQHPEVVATLEVANDVVTITLWNPDKTRILQKFAMSPEEQTSLIARLMPLFEGVWKKWVL